MPIITPTVTKRADLFYREGSSDKVYNVWIENVGANHFVKFNYGRRGSTLTEGTKTGPTHTAEAIKVFDSIVRAKVSKGYEVMPIVPGSKKSPKDAGAEAIRAVEAATRVAMAAFAGTGASPSPSSHKNGLPPMLLNAVDRKAVNLLVTEKDWFFQEKYDGRRMTLGFNDGKITARNKLGKAIEPPSEYCSVLQTHFKDYNFILDGEACGPVFWAFDIIQLESTNCRGLAYEERLVMLGMLLRSVNKSAKQNVIKLALTACSTKEKRDMWAHLEETKREGLVMKDRIQSYISGRPNSGGRALKFKFIESASVIVEKINAKRSVGIYVIDSGHKIPIGNVSVPVNYEMPIVGAVVEVEYLYCYPGGSLFQPVYKGVRDDVTANECRITQLKFKGEGE